jgi:mono/diheme cytochrome c family protein
MRRGLIGVLAAVAALGTAAPAARGEPPGDPGRGRDLARRLCSSCHLVSPEHRGPVPDGVPSFMAIAARPGGTEDRLLGAMVSPPHPAMPAPPLDHRRQMRDTAAYILSLRRP